MVVSDTLEQRRGNSIVILLVMYSTVFWFGALFTLIENMFDQ